MAQVGCAERLSPSQPPPLPPPPPPSVAQQPGTTPVALVASSADLLSVVVFHFNLVDLARAAAVSRALLAAVRTRMQSLCALRWQRAIRGREPMLAQTGFYFHRHVVEVADGILCLPDVNNRGLTTLSDAGEPLRLIKFLCGLTQPRGPAFDGTRVYAVDAAGERCCSISTGQDHEEQAKEGFNVSEQWVGDDALLTPDACAVDGHTLYISDSGHDRVIVVCVDTLQRRGVLGGAPGDGDGRFNRPQGLAARRGLLAVADAGNCRVQLFDGPAPSFLRAVGRPGDAPGCFTEPRGVGLVGARGGGGGLLLLVAESRRLQLLTLRGEPLQVLAPGPAPGWTPGTAPGAPPGSPPLRVGPPGLWGVAVGRGDRRAYVVNAISNELHLLEVEAPQLPRHQCAVDWDPTRAEPPASVSDGDSDGGSGGESLTYSI